MPITFNAVSTEAARAAWNGAPDAYGNPPERCMSDGSGVPCRHCLQDVAAGEPYLVLAWRPFETLQAYTETGPIFLHAEPCRRAEESARVPAMLTAPDYIVRGYDRNERIVYGTGGVVPSEAIADRAEALLANARVAFVHVRSARNNCFQCRVDPRVKPEDDESAID